MNHGFVGTAESVSGQDLQDSAVIRGIFKARELILGGKPDDTIRPRGLLAQTKALGWGVLAEIPGREIVMGAVTQAWMANVVFRALPPDEFTAFSDPGYVKIAWTWRADPIGATESVFRTETRAATTDPTARAKFRWYWSKASPGIWLIRRMTLSPLKREAERRACQARAEQRRPRFQPVKAYTILGLAYLFIGWIDAQTMGALISRYNFGGRPSVYRTRLRV